METDNRMEEGVESAQSAPEHAEEVPDEENLNKGQDLAVQTPEQLEEGILDEGKICLQFSYHNVVRLIM